MTASRSQRPRGAGHCSKHPKHIISLTQLAPWRLVKFGTVLPTGHEVQWLSRPPQVAVPGRRVGTQASPPPGDRALQQPGLWAPVPSGLRSTGKSRMLWGPQDSVCSEETCGPPTPTAQLSGSEFTGTRAFSQCNNILALFLDCEMLLHGHQVHY